MAEKCTKRLAWLLADWLQDVRLVHGCEAAAPLQACAESELDGL